MTRTTSKSAIEGAKAAENLRHWLALGTTNPEHTKQFTRAGGFKGTAIKPIESVRRMTEHFGPCGVGWGMGHPEFQVVPIEGNGELLVFCTLSLWYREADDLSATVFGVGGDKVVARGSAGLRTSDEAFKSAYTDALGNAMKHIGVAADVHMGLFDDSKYVRDTRAGFAGSVEHAPEAPLEPAGEPLHLQAGEVADKGSYHLRSFWVSLSDEQKREIRRQLGTQGQPGCPGTLKDRANRADRKVAAAKAKADKLAANRFDEQYPVEPIDPVTLSQGVPYRDPAEEPERPPAHVDPPLQPGDAPTPDFVVLAQEGGL